MNKFDPVKRTERIKARIERLISRIARDEKDNRDKYLAQYRDELELREAELIVLHKKYGT